MLYLARPYVTPHLASFAGNVRWRTDWQPCLDNTACAPPCADDFIMHPRLILWSSTARCSGSLMGNGASREIFRCNILVIHHGSSKSNRVKTDRRARQQGRSAVSHRRYQVADQAVRDHRCRLGLWCCCPTWDQGGSCGWQRSGGQGHASHHRQMLVWKGYLPPMGQGFGSGSSSIYRA